MKKSFDKKIALFGGTFDPPHVGHALAISSILDSGEFDETWIVPTGDRPDKSANSSKKNRKKMLQLFIADYFPSVKNLKIEFAQLDQILSNSSTFELLNYCQSNNQNCVFKFIIGSDLIQEIDSWYKSKELKEEKPFVVIPRFGNDAIKNLPDYASLLKDTEYQELFSSISSRKIRKLIKENKNYKAYLGEKVFTYISDKKLYT